MAYAAPKPSEMFSDARNGTEVAERFETYKTALADTQKAAEGSPRAFVPGQGLVAKPPSEATVDRVMKSLGTSASVQSELNALKGVIADMGKDWSLSFPNSAGLVPVDLEAPAKLLVPRQTPLRNTLPRTRGQGTARQFKRILGWSNSGVGGVADKLAFMDSQSDTGVPTFGQLALRRGQKITYASDSKSVTYVEQGLSDQVNWKAQFAGQGFQDIRGLSQTALLWATMGAEERGLLYARGASGNGYAGPVAAPSITVASSASGGTVAAGTYYIKVTARAGGGESVASAEVNTGALSGGTNQFTITVATEPTGALGYNAYIGTSSNAETFVTSFSGNTLVITTTPAGGGAAVPSVDSTVSAQGYDGFLTVQADPAQSGYFKRVNAAVTSDSIFQDAFTSLYGANDTTGTNKKLADPEEIWIDGNIRRKLGDYLKGTGSSNYRLSLTSQDAEGAIVGAVVNGVANQVTGTMVELNVHPYMPLGCALIRSRSLPVPESEVSNTSEVVCVQDYMSVEWPVVQFTYDQSTYLYGSLIHYAPAWSGLLVGLS